MQNAFIVDTTGPSVVLPTTYLVFFFFKGYRAIKISQISGHDEKLKIRLRLPSLFYRSKRAYYISSFLGPLSPRLAFAVYEKYFQNFRLVFLRTVMAFPVTRAVMYAQNDQNDQKRQGSILRQVVTVISFKRSVFPGQIVRYCEYSVHSNAQYGVTY